MGGLQSGFPWRRRNSRDVELWLMGIGKVAVSTSILILDEIKGKVYLLRRSPCPILFDAMALYISKLPIK